MRDLRFARWRWPAAVALSLTLLLAFEWAGWPFLRTPAQRLLTESTGLPAQLNGDFKLSLLWNPGLRVEQLRLDDVPGGAGDPVLDAQGMDVRWTWPALWRWHSGGPLQLRSFSAQQLAATLHRDAKGKANWLANAQVPSDSSPPAQSMDWPRVGRLSIEKGRVHIDDAVTDTKLDVKVRGAEGDGAANESDNEPDSGYRVGAQGLLEGLPIELRVRSSALLPLLRSDEDEAASPVALRVEAKVGQARLDFEGSAAALLSAPRLQGELRLRAVSMAAVGDVLCLGLPRTPPFELRGELRHGRGVWQLRDARATVGDSRLGGNFRYDMRSSPPKLSGRLNGSRLLLADLGPAVGVPVKAKNAAKQPIRLLPDQAFDLPALGRMDADLQIDIDELGFDSPQLGAMKDLRARLTLSASVLRLDELQVRVGGGRFWGSMRLDGSDKVAELGVDLRFKEVEVSQWILAVRKSDSAPGAGAGDGQAQAANAYLNGKLTGALSVQGRGRSTAQILGTLDGRADVRLGDGSVSHLVTEVAGLDIAQSLGVAVTGDKQLPIHCARLDLQVRDGVADTRVGVLDNRDSTVRVQGQVSLRDETLDLRTTVKPKDVSLLSLRAPLRIAGTLAAPEVSVETEGLAARAVASVALGVIATPAAALLPWIEFGSDPEESPCVTDGAVAAASAPVSR